MDGASRSKHGPAGFGGVLCNYKGEVLIMFSKHIGVCDLNQAELLTTLEAIRMFLRDYSKAFIVKSDSSNAVAWVSISETFPWKL